MKKPLKIVVGIVAALVVLIVAAVVVITLVVDPNDYKPELAALVEKNTGHKVEFSGPLELKVFPGLALSIKKVQVLADSSFGETPLLALDEASLDMALLPLLSGRLEIESILLDGANLALVTNAEGRNNWDMPDAAKNDEQEETAAKQEAGAPAVESRTESSAGGTGITGEIASFKVQNCSLNYRNLQTDQDVSLQINELELNDLSLGKDMSVMLDMSAADKASSSELAATLEGKVRFDPAAGLAAVDLPKLGFTLNSKLIKEPQTLEGNLKADASLQSLAGNLALAMQNSNLALSVNAKSQGYAKGQEKGLPVVSGVFALKSNPAKLMNILGVDLSMADEQALALFEMNIPFATRANSGVNELVLDPIKGQLDSTQIGGKLIAEMREAGHDETASLPAGVDYRARLNLDLGEIDLNRYLPRADSHKEQEQKPAPAAAKGSQSSPPQHSGQKPSGSDGPKLQVTEAPAAPPHGPLAGTALEKALAEAHIKLNKAVIKKTSINEVSAQLNLNRGVAEFNLLGAKALEGGLSAAVKADLVKAKAPVSLTAKGQGFDMGIAVQEFLESDKFSGKADFDTTLSFSGLAWAYADGGGISKTLNGHGRFKVTDGKIQNFQIIPANVPEALLPYRQDDYPFENLGGSFNAANGVIKNNDLLLKSPELNITGAGTVDLAANNIDYRLQVAIPDPNNAAKNKLTLPLMASGSLDDIKYGPDVAAIGKGVVGGVVDKLKEGEGGKGLDETIQGVKDIFRSFK